MNQYAQITNTDWRSIVRKIEKQRSLIVLGPQAFRNPNRQIHQEGLISFLQEKAGKYILKHYPNEDFYLFDRVEGPSPVI